MATKANVLLNTLSLLLISTIISLGSTNLAFQQSSILKTTSDNLRLSTSENFEGIKSTNPISAKQGININIVQAKKYSNKFEYFS